MRYLKTLVIVFIMFLAVPSFAQNEDAQFDNFIKAIDVVPTLAQLNQFPDAQQRLTTAVSNVERTSWERQRALSLLSFYPNQGTRVFMTQTLRTSEDEGLRRIAVYSLGRTFGPSGDDTLVLVIQEGLKDPAQKVVEYALRSLRYVSHESALEVLRTYSSSSNPRLASIASAALKKSAFRKSQQ